MLRLVYHALLEKYGFDESQVKVTGMNSLGFKTIFLLCNFYFMTYFLRFKVGFGRFTCKTVFDDFVINKTKLT